MSTKTDRLLASLQEAAERRRQAEKQCEHERVALARLLQQGARAGVPVVQMARTVGVTRKRVYEILAKPPALERNGSRAYIGTRGSK